ncbi:POK6 protein, partial [Burhinus bistriatus]|nr:POK6 protein [Burhinus bistriatus]
PHWTHCFAILGVPKLIKNDNGPVYQLHAIKLFLQNWGIDHVFGIPRSPTGQAIVECAHKN